jgi:hypothetical protein
MRIEVRCSRLPRKCFVSVRTEMAAAPPSV